MSRMWAMGVNGMRMLRGPSLTGKRRVLVATLVMAGCSVKEAARKAGYSLGANGESGRVAASKTLRLPHVRQYMQEQMMASFGMASPPAFRRMLFLLENAESEHVQIEAAKQILDRAGYTVRKDERFQISTPGFEFRIDLS